MMPQHSPERTMRKISIVVPAHNEQGFIPKCLESIRTAESRSDIPVEIVVVLNRCTDGTEDIAKQYGAITVRQDDKNLARIRNTGIKASTGDVIVTIDADSWMTPNMLQEVARHLDSGRYIGGGVWMKPERISLGIFFSLMMVAPHLLAAGISAGMFWLYRKDFEAVGGFDERLVSAEDYHFAKKLKRYGKERGLRYGTVKRAHIVTSCRKFDRFGDWYLAKNPRLVRQIFKGTNRKVSDGFYYDADG
jgi:glycosyltransferase involved in cell wall biosynthesis